jgi:hypothetical protein
MEAKYMSIDARQPPCLSFLSSVSRQIFFYHLSRQSTVCPKSKQKADDETLVCPEAARLCSHAGELILIYGCTI